MAKKAKQANLEPIIAKIVEIHAIELDRTDSDTMRLIVQEYVDRHKLKEKYAHLLKEFEG